MTTIVNKNKLSFTALILTATLCGQNASIKNIEVETRENGITLSLHLTETIQLSEISGWFNEATSWSYLTFYNIKGDTSLINAIPKSNGITSIEALQFSESLQIGLRSDNPIYQFEFYHDKNDSTVIASLRYPLSTAMAYIEKQEIMSKKKNLTLFSTILNANTPYYLISIILAGLLIHQL
mgnify:FL=1